MMTRKEFLSVLGLGALGSTVFVAGCSDFLGVNNPNNLTPETFWKDADDAMANVAAIYNQFKGPSGWACADNWYYRQVPAMYRSDIHGITHDVAAWWAIANFTLSATNNTAAGLWSNNYTGIFRANQAITHLPEISDMEAGLQSRLVGEAKFLRAYFYFSLVTNFLNVPLITTLQSSEEYSVPQAPPEEVWAQIEKDLADAARVLPSSYNADDVGRVTKGAALGYLGKSYLYQEKWSEAAATFQQIIDAGTYTLLPDYADVFSLDHENSEESLLEVQYAREPINGESQATPRNYEEGPSEAGGWYECYPNTFIFEEFQKEQTVDGKLDPRLNGTIIWNTEGMTLYGTTYQEMFGADATTLVWRKYNESELGEPLSEYSGKNWRVLRYADVLLMHAEALNEGGQTSEAYRYVNQVRRRARLADLNPGAGQAALRKEIEHQRLLELADEGVRFYDLLRWGTIKENLVAHDALGGENFVEGKHEYLPIPLSELQTNTEVKQNPGY